MPTIVGMLALAAVALSDVTRMSPSAAGELLLEHESHDEIVAIVDPPGPTMVPRRYVKILQERPHQRQFGCVRKSWNVSFQADNDSSGRNALLSDVYSYEEVQLSSGGCSGETWTRVAGGDTERALAVLNRFSAKLHGQGKLVESCQDETSSQLCANDDVTLRKLLEISPWLIGVDEGKDYLWLSPRGASGFTEVRLGEHLVDGMVIIRRVPAPF